MRPPPCAQCGKPSDGFASSGARPEVDKAVLGFSSCMDCRLDLNNLVAKLVVVVVAPDGTWNVASYARDVTGVEARKVEGS